MQKNAADQMLLPLTLEARINEQPFFVDAGNRQAWQWLEKWPAWPQSGLIVHGYTGWGTTYLGLLWSKKVRAHVLSAVCPDPAQSFFESKKPPCVWIQDVHHWVQEDTLVRKLLAVYNSVRENAGTCLLTGRLDNFDRLLPDLASRLKAMPRVSLSPPSTQLLEAVLEKYFAAYQMGVSGNVIKLLAAHLPHHLSKVKKVVEELVKESLRLQQPVTQRFVLKRQHLWAKN